MRIRFLIVAVAEVLVVEEQQQWSLLNLLTCHLQKDRGSTLLHLLLIHLHKVYLSLPIWSVFSLCNVHRSTFSFSTLILHNARSLATSYHLYYMSRKKHYPPVMSMWFLFLSLNLLYMYFYYVLVIEWLTLWFCSEVIVLNLYVSSLHFTILVEPKSIDVNEACMFFLLSLATSINLCSYFSTCNQTRTFVKWKFSK